jgi:hypothetical protein
MAKPSKAHSFSMPVAPKHDQYEVEDAARTMERHAEIKSKPALHRAAKHHLKKKLKNLHKVVHGK